MQKRFTHADIANTDYIDGYQYYDGVLKFFPTSEGYVSNTVVEGVNVYNYVYNYTDHLGNIRLSYGLDEHGDTKTLEENHYYPFGLRHTNYNNDLKEYGKKEDELAPAVVLKPPVDDDGQLMAPTYKYKYNGMEWQDEVGLKMYDMDMRDYDPGIVRWVNVDPVTHFDQSSYCAFNGNPVFFSDPSGADGEPINTWHMAGSGSTNAFLYGGAGNLGVGDHMLGSSGDEFWMGNGATTWSAPMVSQSGNTFTINMNAAINNGKSTWRSSTGLTTHYIYHAGYLEPNPEFGGVDQLNELGEVGVGYWEKAIDYSGDFLSLLEIKANIDAYSTYNYGTVAQTAEELTLANAARMGTIAKWSNGAGTALQVLPVGLAYYQEGYVGKNTRVAAVRASGALLGAVAGAEIGAAFGFWFGGVGAIPGAAVGAVFGVIGGYFGANLGGDAAEGAYQYIIK